MAFIAYETKVAVGRGATPVWTDLAEVTGVTLPSLQAEQINVTSFDTPDRMNDYISGRIDAGEVSVEMNWTPNSATDTVLLAIQASGEKVQLRFTIPAVDSEDPDFVETWNAICVNYERTPDVNSQAIATATFRVTTKVTGG